MVVKAGTKRATRREAGGMARASAVNNPTTSVGGRHLDLRHFRTREYIKSMKLTVSYISTKLNVADLFTKPLIYGAFSLFKKTF